MHVFAMFDCYFIYFISPALEWGPPKFELTTAHADPGTACAACIFLHLVSSQSCDLIIINPYVLKSLQA